LSEGETSFNFSLGALDAGAITKKEKKVTKKEIEKQDKAEYEKTMEELIDDLPF
jgi:hypothetical protein